MPYLPTLNTARAKLHILNLCAVNEKFDIGSPSPSRSCLHMYTTLSLDRTPLPCACKSDWKTHKLDWYGDDEAHAEWRRKARVHVLTDVWSFIKPTIIDRLSPSPLPSTLSHQNASHFASSASIYLTDARIAQKMSLIHI